MAGSELALDPGEAPFTKVEVRCGGDGCGCVWEVHRHREAASIVAEKGPRLGVTMTVERPGPKGSRRYRCHCGYERKLSTERLALRSREAFKAGHSTIVAGVDL